MEPVSSRTFLAASLATILPVFGVMLMQRKTVLTLFSIALLAAMVLTPVAEAQRGPGGRRGQDGQGPRGQDGQGRRGQFGGRGGGFGGGPGGAGVAILGLLRIEAVRDELKVTEDQQELVEILSDELREGRPDFPDNYRDLSDEEQAAFREEFGEKMRKRNEEQTAQAKDTLQAILEESQYARLKQISIQTQGIRALLDAEVATALKLTDDQKQKIEAAQEAMGEETRDAMREVFAAGGGFDRDAIREKFEELRQASETKVLALLSADQKIAFEGMKGSPFEMPEGTRGGFGGGRGGFGFGGGGRGRGPGGGGGRPQRPE